MSNTFVYSIRRKIQTIFFSLFSKEFVSKTYFRLILKEKLCLENPRTFNEKIQWLKLYEWPDNELCITCSDKYMVRDYLTKNGYSKYLNKLIGVYDNVNEIDWEALPDKFVLKCNHGCAYNIICTNKDLMDQNKIKKKLSKWLREDFGKYNAELHYSKIKRKIICEEYLGDNLCDYKFFCFNGKCKFLYVAIDSDSSKKEREAFFNPDGSLINVVNSRYEFFEDAKIPSDISNLVTISEELSHPFPFVRVDWYIKNGKPIFGEFTFTPSGGLMRLKPRKFDEIFGNYIDIDNLIKLKNE